MRRLDTLGWPSRRHARVRKARHVGASAPKTPKNLDKSTRPRPSSQGHACTLSITSGRNEKGPPAGRHGPGRRGALRWDTLGWALAAAALVVVTLLFGCSNACRAPATPHDAYRCCYNRCVWGNTMSYQGNQVTMARECQALCRGHL